MRLLATSEGIVPLDAAPLALPEPARRGWLKRLGAVLGGSLLANSVLARPRGATQIAALEPFVGEIMMCGFNFAPRGWALCNGQLLPIAQNTALFSLLGTQFGGNGQTNFALPDLRGRFPTHQGTGPGLSLYDVGQAGGAENVTLLQTQMPTHTHSTSLNLAVGSSPATSSSPVGNILASTNGLDVNGAPVGVNAYSAAAANAASANAAVTGNTGATGGSQPASNLPPYLCLNFAIALQGVFPTQ